MFIISNLIFIAKFSNINLNLINPNISCYKKLSKGLSCQNFLMFFLFQIIVCKFSSPKSRNKLLIGNGCGPRKSLQYMHNNVTDPPYLQGDEIYHKKGRSRLSCKNRGITHTGGSPIEEEVKNCFLLMMYRLCSSNSLYSEVFNFHFFERVNKGKNWQISRYFIIIIKVPGTSFQSPALSQNMLETFVIRCSSI